MEQIKLTISKKKFRKHTPIYKRWGIYKFSQLKSYKIIIKNNSPQEFVHIFISADLKPYATIWGKKWSYSSEIPEHKRMKGYVQIEKSGITIMR